MSKEHLRGKEKERKAAKHQVRLDKYITFKDLEPDYKPTEEDIAKKKEFVKRKKR